MATIFKCYWNAVSEAWANRHRWGEGNRQGDALAFLPAALEIQERPPSPVGRVLGWALMCLATIGVAWSCIGKVDIVAVAEGKIIPGGRVKQIQPLEKGVVKTIYVTEGQPVKRGDALVELDQTLTRADQTRLLGDLRFTQLALARQRALQQLLERQRAGNPAKLNTPEDLPLVWDQTLTDGEPRSQRRLLWQQWLDYQSRLGALQSQLQNREAERQVSAAVIEKLD